MYMHMHVYVHVYMYACFVMIGDRSSTEKTNFVPFEDSLSVSLPSLLLKLRSMEKQEIQHSNIHHEKVHDSRHHRRGLVLGK